MDKFQIVLLWLTLICVSLAVVISVLAINIQQRKRIRKKCWTGEFAKSLRQLNKAYADSFFDIPPLFRYGRTCLSKREYDRLNLEEYFIAILQKQAIVWELETAQKNIEKNCIQFQNYTDALSNAVKEHSIREKYTKETHPHYKLYEKYESEVWKKYVLPPPTQVLSIECSKTYISPQGRNRYFDHELYSYRDMLECKEMADNQIRAKSEYSSHVQAERSKMTDSLRYDVLRRDGYRCRICGASSSDGAKLEVDHIIPVSKGGKTEMSNLQTLCMRCNRGKRDKL